MTANDRWPFYRADDSKVGDVMPCFFDGKFHIYYLRFGNLAGGGSGNEYSVRETTDFVHYSPDRRVGIFGGTGEIIKHNGKYHLFKCVGEIDGVTAIGHYIGETPYAFEPTNHFIPSDNQIYVPWAWRDPRIFWVEEEQCFWMLVATNQKTDDLPARRNACVGLCKSKDLQTWTHCEPLFSPLALEGTYECPDMFRMGDWYYLIYSNANHNKLTHYVKGRSMYGPWIIPEDDTLDSYLFYAGRVASDGQHYYIAAWNAERTGADLSMRMGLRDVEQSLQPPEEDFGPLGYAGDMVIHQLGQRANGDLTCLPIPEVVRHFDKALPLRFRDLQGRPWRFEGQQASIASPSGYACALAGELPERCMVTMDIAASGREVGFVVGADETFIGHGLFLRLQLSTGRIQAMNGMREIGGWNGYCMPFAVELEKFVRPDSNGLYHITLMQDRDVLCLYINGEALSLRAQSARHGQLGLYAYDAQAQFSHIQISEVGDE